MPTTSAPQGSATFTPDAAPRWKETKQDPVPTESRPKTNLTTIASSKKTSMGDFARLLERPRTDVSKPVDNPQPPTPESASRPGAASESVVVKNGPSKIQLAKTPILGIPLAVWYALATVLSALFTYIGAPLIVDVIKGRIASGSQSRPT
jgi:hypothetical protein